MNRTYARSIFDVRISFAAPGDYFNLGGTELKITKIDMQEEMIGLKSNSDESAYPFDSISDMISIYYDDPEDFKITPRANQFPCAREVLEGDLFLFVDSHKKKFTMEVVNVQSTFFDDKTGSVRLISIPSGYGYLELPNYQSHKIIDYAEESSVLAAAETVVSIIRRMPDNHYRIIYGV